MWINGNVDEPVRLESHLMDGSRARGDAGSRSLGPRSVALPGSIRQRPS